MKFGILVFPGSNCDEDALHAARDVLGQEAEYLWHKDADLKGADVVVLPGGFAHGDYLRCGAMARFSPIMRDAPQCQPEVSVRACSHPSGADGHAIHQRMSAGPGPANPDRPW